jgi:hypothetical protein
MTGTAMHYRLRGVPAAKRRPGPEWRPRQVERG